MLSLLQQSHSLTRSRLSTRIWRQWKSSKVAKLDPCEELVIKALKRAEFPPNATMLLCISGGVDSIALLHIFQKIRTLNEWKSLQLKIMHFNHKVRPESDEEVIDTVCCGISKSLLYMLLLVCRLYLCKP